VWGSALKKNIQSSLKQHLQELGLSYNAPTIDSIPEEHAKKLAAGFIEFGAIEAQLLATLNKKNNAKEFFQNEATFLDPYILPEGMQLLGNGVDPILFCKATDNNYSTQKVIKEVAIVAGSVVLVVILVVAIAVASGGAPGSAGLVGNLGKDIGNYPLSEDYIGCALSDPTTHKILWYNAEAISRDSKIFANVHNTIGNILKKIPLNIQPSTALGNL